MDCVDVASKLGGAGESDWDSFSCLRMDFVHTFCTQFRIRDSSLNLNLTNKLDKSILCKD